MSNKTDLGGTITTGGVAQQISTGGYARNGLSFQNLSDIDLYVRFGGTASAGAGSIKVPAGALYETPSHMAPAGNVSVFGATTGKAFTAWEW